MNRTLSGAYSGFIATGPMTVMMMAIQEFLPEAEKSPLPPATLSLQLVKRITGKKTLAPDTQTMLTLMSHFAYGAAAGILYSQTAGRFKTEESNPGTGIGKGAFFGAAFWAANYLGVTPLLKLRADGTEMTPARNLMMFTSHILWSGVLGFAEEVLRDSGKELLAGERKAPRAE